MAVSSPAQILSKYSRELMALPGSNFAAADRAANTVRVHYDSPQLARLADAVFKGTIEGVRLLSTFTDSPGGAPAPMPWEEKASNMRKAVAALPGVWNYAVEPQLEATTFYTNSDDATVRMRTLVNERLGDYKAWFVTVKPGGDPAASALPPQP